jgi:hypothetical protein
MLLLLLLLLYSSPLADFVQLVRTRSLVVCNQTIYLFIFFVCGSSIKFIRTRHSAPVCVFINDWRPAVDHRKIKKKEKKQQEKRRENEPSPPHRSPHSTEITWHFIIRCFIMRTVDTVGDFGWLDSLVVVGGRSRVDTQVVFNVKTLKKLKKENQVEWRRRKRILCGLPPPHQPPPTFFPLLFFVSTKEIENPFSLTNSILYLYRHRCQQRLFHLNEARFSCVCRFAVAGERVREHPRLSSVVQ